VKIYVDADACPVKDIIVSVGRALGFAVDMIVSYDHRIESGLGIEVVSVEPGPNAVDLVIANRVNPGDVVVTADFGLAALVLGKKGRAISPRGLVFHERNIDELLMSRHLAEKIRRAGGKTKGPSPLKEVDREKFRRALVNLLKNQ